MTVKDRVFVYKLFDKLDALPFSSFACLTLIVAFPNQYFILLIVGEFLRIIARSSLLYKF